MEIRVKTQKIHNNFIHIKKEKIFKVQTLVVEDQKMQ